MNRRVLEDRLKVLGQLIPDKETEIGAARQQLAALKNERESIVAKLASGSPKGVTVSDHALVRWLQRTGQIDPEAVRSVILTPDRIAAIEAGANSIKVCGVEMVVKGQTVVTVK